MKDIFYKDHIMVIDNSFPHDKCDELIDYYEGLKDSGFGIRDHSIGRQDNQIPVQFQDSIRTKDLDTIRYYNDHFWDNVYPHYLEKNTILQTQPTHTIESWKIQKTKVGGGFHNWHIEHGDSSFYNLRRILVFTTYLNDVAEGGETEFLVQSLRCDAKKGRTVVWPAYFTHPHRGNPPISNDKYIVTGWVEYAS